MNHWIIAPVILPAMLAPLIGFVMRHDISLARAASVTGTIFLAAISVGLLILATSGETHVYKLGDWEAPYGIVLVLDRLSALMVFLTSLLALIVLIHAIATGWDNRGRHFHALFQFQLMGICGAFLTGDVFNLFVFFEVLLIASYGLMIHSGGKARLQAGLQYVVINLAGSTLFLFALGTLYATTGTLNIAHLAVRLSEIPVEDAALVRVATMLLMIVFAVKAALFPVQFWLPGTYANAPAPVAALFAIMTKVGAYAILRVHTLAFGPEIAATEGVAGSWLFPAAIVTIAIGAVGVLGARRLMPLIAFSVVGSMGTLMIAISAFTPEATTAALYYLVHSTFAAGGALPDRRPRGDAARGRRARGDAGHAAERALCRALLRRRDRHGGDAAAQRVSRQALRAGRDARSRRAALGLDRDPRGLALHHRGFCPRGLGPVLEIHRHARRRAGRGRGRGPDAARRAPDGAGALDGGARASGAALVARRTGGRIPRTHVGATVRPRGLCRRRARHGPGGLRCSNA
jgi:NADH:ubiquinone oxidoreductase subunit 2 (subunit N)